MFVPLSSSTLWTAEKKKLSPDWDDAFEPPIPDQGFLITPIWSFQLLQKRIRTSPSPASTAIPRYYSSSLIHGRAGYAGGVHWSFTHDHTSYSSSGSRSHNNHKGKAPGVYPS